MYRPPRMIPVVLLVLFLGFLTPFSRTSLSFAVSSYMTEEKLTPENLKAARRAAAWKPRRVIMNNDGNDSGRAKEKTREAFLQSRTTSLAGSQVDAIFYCDGIWGTFTHASPTADLRAGSDAGYVEWAVDLVKDGGPDPLGSVTDFAHENNMEVFWSLRMNDTHDAGDPTMMSPWKKTNPDLLVGTYEDRQSYKAGGRRWSAADYSKQAVRNRTVGWFEEVAQGYDVDGFELDFFRHPIFFKNPLHGKPATQENLDQMTEVVRQIRQIADRHALRRGRPILVAIRVPDSVEYCKEIGLDVERWLQEGLIDMMTVSGYFRLNRWETSVEWGHRHDVPVFAGLSESRITKPERKFKNSIEEYRGRACNAWKAGVDGIYIFNIFNPKSPVFREVGDPTQLATMDKVFTTGARSVRISHNWVHGGLKYVHRPFPLPDRPLSLSATKPVTVVVDIGGTVNALAADSKPFDATVQLNLTGVEDPLAVLVTLHGHTLTDGKRNEDGWITYSIPNDAFKAGANSFELKKTSKAGKDQPVILQDLAVWVKKKGSSRELMDKFEPEE